MSFILIKNCIEAFLSIFDEGARIQKYYFSYLINELIAKVSAFLSVGR